MKSFLRFASLLLLQFCFIYPVLLAQTPDSWSQKANFGGTGRYNAVGFSIGNKGYIGTGANATNVFSDIWEYDPATDTWAQKADFGGGARHGACAFTVGRKAYIGGGASLLADGSQASFTLWEYDPVLNTWVQKSASFPGGYRSVALNIDGKVYVFYGSNISYPVDIPPTSILPRKSSNTWVLYDIESNSSIAKTNLPIDRYGLFGFSIDGKGYLGGGVDVNGVVKNEFYEYNPNTNTWTAKTNFPGTRAYATPAFVLGNKGYVGLTGPVGSAQGLYEYNPATNIWTSKASYPDGNTYGGVGFSIGDKGYIGTGSSKRTFYEYTSTETLTPATALKFDPSETAGDNSRLNYVSVDNPFRGFQKEITVEFWMYAPSANMPFGSIMGQGSNNVDANWVWLMHPETNGTMTFYVSDGASFKTAKCNIIAGSWHHYAATSSAGSTKFYVDGNEVSFYTINGQQFNDAVGGGLSSGLLSNNNAVLHIGKDVRYATRNIGNNDPKNRYAVMTIDELRIWNRALCADEIRHNKNVEINPAVQTGLQHYYSFNQGFVNANNPGETILYDLSGNSRNGELKNFTLYGTNSNWATSGFTSTGTYTLYDNSPAPITGLNNICIGTSTTLSNAVSGGKWLSSNPGVATINELTGLVNAISAGVTTITYTRSCGAVSSMNLSVNPIPTTSITGTNTICSGATTTLTASGAIGTTYLWNTGATTASINVSPTATTTYTVTATNAGGCTAQASSTVTVNAVPTVSISGTNIICSGSTTTLTASGGTGTTYLWNTGATTASINVSPTATTTYTVTATNAVGCTTQASNTVTVNAAPTASISGTNIICSGGSTTLIATGGGGGTTYAWNTGATTFAIPVSPTVTTTYSVTLTNTAGCTSQASTTVTVNPKPSVTASSNSPVVSGNTLQLSANGTTNYSWSGPNGFTSSLQNPVINNATAAANGTYTVTGTNAGPGCTNTASVNVTVLSTPATALKTDGVDDHITISNPFRAFNKEITVEFWMNTPTGRLAQGSVMGQSSLNVDGMGTDVWLMHPDLGGTNLDFYVNDAGTWRRATVPIRAGGWHHYVGVASEFGIKFYVDGVLEQTGTGISTGIQSNPNAIMQIGKDPRHTNFRFADMTIDEVRIWSRALCLEEITNNKNCELNPAGQNGLQQYYRFNQGIVGANNSTETTLTDLSGNNRNGVLSGFALTGANSNWVASGSTNTGTCISFSTPTAPITGTTTICGIGNTSTLSNAIAGGLWSSSNTNIATINANTGLVTALNEGTTTITYKNECGGISTITVRVVSTASPTITGPEGGTNACPGNTVTLTAPTGLFNYQWFRDGVAVTSTTSTRTYNATVSGTYTATRISFGCTSTVSNALTVTIADAIKPTITCPANQTLNLDATCKATLPDYRNLVTVSDNCTPTGSLVITQSPAPGTIVEGRGGFFVTISVRDAANNEATCTIPVDKVDVTKPVINCPAPITVNNTANTCGATVTYSMPTATDNCNGPAFNFWNTGSGEPNNANVAGEDYLELMANGRWNDLPNANTLRSIIEFNDIRSNTYTGYTRMGTFEGHTYYLSTATATWQNSRTAAQGIGADMVSINTIAENEFLYQYLAANGGGVAWAGGYQDRNDAEYAEPGTPAQNFGGWKWTDGTRFGASQVVITQIAGLPSGSVFPFGQTVNTFRATDQSGNSIECSFIVTVRDNQPPVMTCTAPIVVNNAANTCGAVVTFTAPTATDNCGFIPFTSFRGGEPNQFQGATQDYLQIYTDGTWDDLQNTVLNKWIVEFNTIITTSFAGYTRIGELGGHTYYVSTSTATWINARASAQSIGGDLVSINTQAENNFVAPSGIAWVGGYQDISDSKYIEPGNGSQNYGGWKWVDGTSMSTQKITITQTAGLPSGSVFPVGVTTNTFIARDESGNESTCSFTVTVRDVQPPVISCPANINVTATSSAGAVVNYTTPIGTDNCSGATTTRTAGLASGSTFPIGTTTVTHRVTDAAGLSTECSFTVSVSGLAPVIVSPGNQTVNVAPGTCSAVVNFAATETTGIPASTITYSIPSGSTFGTGSTVVTATATNAVGTSSVQFTITVLDAQPPVITCPADITVTATSAAGAIVNYVTPVGTDNCPGATTTRTAGLASGSVFPQGTTTVTHRVTDAAGNFTTCSFNVIVNAPTVVASALNFDGVDDYVVVNNPYRAFGKEITVEFWMNTPNAIMPFGSVMGQSTSGVDNMSTNVWLMHPNTAGGIDFLVNDNGTWKGATVPIKAGGWHHYVGVASEFGTKFYVDGVLEATGPAITTGIVNNPNSVIHIGKDVRHNTGRFGNITVDEVRIWNRVLCEEEINNSKNCELNPSGLTGLQEYYRFNQGFVNFDNVTETTLIDASGNARNGQLTNMSLTGGSSNWVASGSTNTGTCTSYSPPTAPITGTTYICLGSTSTLSNAIPGGLWSSSNPSVATIDANTGLVTSVSPGLTTITYKNECGGISTTNVSTPNLITPAITAPVGGTNVCPGNTVTLSATPGVAAVYQWYKDGVAISGATSRNYTATVSGIYTVAKTSIPCFSPQSSPVTVTIADAVKPSITCPQNQTLNLDATCKATLPDYRSLLTVSDNCTATGSLVITQSPAAGSVVNDKGDQIVSFTVRDAAGNESTCTITVTKKDVTAPVISCNAPIVVNNTPNTCGAVVNFINPTATDNCSGGAFNFWSGGEPNNYQNANEDYVQLYTNGTWNDLPNSSLNRSIVEFNDIRSNVYSGYTLIGTYGGHTYYISNGTATWTSSRAAAQAIGGDLASINTLGESTFLAPYGGNTWVGGYQDKTVPGFQEPGNASQNYLGWKWVDGTQLGGGQISITQIAGLPSGSVFPVGITTNTFIARDESGNESTCSFTVTVRDVQAPVINCPANINATATSANGAVVNYTTPVGTDNCPGATTERTAGLASGSTFPIGTTTVTYRVTDAAGLFTECSFTVTVVGVAPVITCPANITVNAAAGTCAANVNFAATETVGIPASTITYTINGNQVASGASFPVGTTTVVATATNAVGSSSCSFTVTVVDNQNPTITAPANAQGNNTAGLCTGTVILGTPVTADNCGVASVTNDAPTTGIFPVGSTTVTWTVTDIHGNKATATQTVVILDNEKPTISVTNVNVNNDAGKCGANVTIAQPETADNCGVATVAGVRSDNQLLTADYPVGTTTITWTVRDVNGNTESTTQTIVVTDNEKPTISVTNVNVNNDAGKCGASVTIAQPETADNCGVATVAGVRSDNASLSADYPVGTTTITWTVTDIHGNHATTTQTIVVNDTELPVVKTRNIVVQLGANGQASITTSQINNGSTDNCGIATMVLDKLNFNCSNVGENTVLLTVTDIHGNSASANATVTVQDNILPTVITQPVTVTLVNGAASVTAAQVNNGSFDNCGIATMTVSPANFNCNNIGSNTVILTVTDVNGNTNTRSAIVTVVGQLPSCSITSVPTSNVFTGGNPNNIYLGYGAQSTVLNVAATGGSSYTYQWSGTATQMLNSTTAAAPVFTPTAPGNYTFMVTVTNSFGCTSTCSITICVKDIRVPGTGLKGSPAKVYICHVPPGNNNNPQTLEISVNAVGTHIGQHSGDRLGTCAMTPCAEPAPTTVANALISKAVVEGESKATTNEELKVTVMPNPSATYFTLKLESKYDAPVNMRVVDVSGRVVDNRVKLGSNATVEVGHNYQSGTYFAEFIQGNRRKVVQLLKIKR